MQRILVTGGAGFLGSHFVRHLVEHTDASVTVLDLLTDAASPEALTDLPSDRCRLVVGDVADAALVGPLVAEHDAVVHHAAATHNDASLADPGPFVHTNLVGTFTVLEAVRAADVRLHHVSTDEVYGDLPLDSVERFTADAPYRPSSPYAATKAGADHLVRAWVRSFGLRATISHCSNSYGAWQHVEKFIPRQVTELLEGRPARIYGTGAHVRDWIHAADHSSAVAAILERGRIGETYLIGSDPHAGGVERSNLEVARLILQLMDRDPDDPQQLVFVADRAGHDLRYALDSRRLREELGWAPVHDDLATGLAQTIDWFTSHADWWRPRKAATEASAALRGQ